MFPILVLALIGCCIFKQNLSLLLSPVAETLHSWCLAASPRLNTPIHQALVCGHPLSFSRERLLFQQSSLIHLLVVSGSHLLSILALCRLLRLKPSTQTVTLLIFTAMCGLEPPLIRSLFALSLTFLNQLFRFNWHPCQIVLYSGLSALIFNPSWAGSYSLLLSWTSALVLAFLAATPLPLLARETLMWLVLTPLLLNFAEPHPSGILFNTLLAPVIGHFLFPLSLLCFLIPPLAPLFTFLWQLLVQTLEVSVSTHSSTPHSLPLFALWLYLLTLHFTFEFFRPFKRAEPKSWRD